MFFVVYFLHASGQMFFCQTPGQRPPHITGRRVNTVTRGWIGALDERAPFRIHDAAVGVVDRCLSRTRNFVALNQTYRLSFSQAFLAPTSAQECFFSFVFKSFAFRRNIRAHSERYRNTAAGIIEIQYFYGNIAFPLASA